MRLLNSPAISLMLLLVLFFKFDGLLMTEFFGLLLNRVSTGGKGYNGLTMCPSLTWSDIFKYGDLLVLRKLLVEYKGGCGRYLIQNNK